MNSNNQLDLNGHTIETPGTHPYRSPANNETQSYNLAENSKNYNWLNNNENAKSGKFLPPKKSKSKKTNNDTVCYETNDNVISIRF